MIGPNKILVDKEKAFVDGKEAYRLYFYDEQTGTIVKVISFVIKDDLYLNEPQQAREDEGSEHQTNVNIEEMENAIHK